MGNSKIKIFIVDALMSFIAVFGVVMFFPMLLSLQNHFRVSVSEISWIPNLGYLTMIIFAAVLGKVVNKTGIKSMILITLILWILGLVLELIALESVIFYIFVIGRFIEGVSEAFVFPLLISMNKARFEEGKDQKIGSSLIEFGGAIGGLTSATISGRFVNFPEKFLIIPMAIAVVTILFITIKIRKIPSAEGTQIINSEAEAMESTKSYVSFLFMILIIQIVFSSIQVYMSYYMEVFKEGALTGTIISVEQVAVILGTLAPIFIFNKMNFKYIRNIIVVTLVLGIVLLAMHISIYLSIAAAFETAFFVGVGFTVLNIYLSKIIRTKFSEKLSLYASIRNSGGFILSFIWGRLIEVLRNSGKGYGYIFKYLYSSEVIIIVTMFIIIVFLQKDNKGYIKNR